MKAFWRRPLACRDVVELVTDYLEGALARSDRLLLFAGWLRHADKLTRFRSITGAASLAAEDRPWPRKNAVMHMAEDTAGS